MDVLRKIEQVPVKTSGMFVMALEPIAIPEVYCYSASRHATRLLAPGKGGGQGAGGGQGGEDTAADSW